MIIKCIWKTNGHYGGLSCQIQGLLYSCNNKEAWFGQKSGQNICLETFLNVRMIFFPYGRKLEHIPTSHHTHNALMHTHTQAHSLTHTPHGL